MPGGLTRLTGTAVARITTTEAIPRQGIAEKTRGTVAICQAFRAAVAGNQAVGPIGVERAAVVVVDLAFDADEARVVAAVSCHRAHIVVGAALGAGSRRQIAGEAGSAVWIDAALDAAMERGVTASQAARRTVSVSDTLETESALAIAAQRGQRAFRVDGTALRPTGAGHSRLAGAAPAAPERRAAAAGWYVELKPLVAGRRQEYAQPTGNLHGLARMRSASGLPKPFG